MTAPQTARHGAAGASARAGAHVDPVLVVLVALAVLVAAGYGFGVGGAAAQVLTSWLLTGVTNLFFAVTMWRVARLPNVSRPARRLWYMAAFAGAAYLLGDLLQLVAVVGDPVAPESIVGTSAQSACVVLGTAALILGMLSGHSGAAGAGSRLRLDIATVMAAATTVGLYTFTIPPGGPSVGWAFELVVTLLVAPGVFLVAVFSVVRLILGGRAPFTRAAGTLGGLAALSQGLLQSVPPERYLTEGQRPLLLAGNVGVSILLAIGARAQWRGGRNAEARSAARPARPYSALPYAAIAATNALLVFVLLDEGLTGRAWLVIAGSLVSTALVVVRQLAALGHIAELLTERDALAARLTELAFHDGLTGLANRALFGRRLTEALQGGEGELAVVLVDLDDFKPVNDRYGHAAGDELLRQVGTWLSEAVRESDTVARLGGDEFAVLLTGLRAGEAEELTERIRAALHRSTSVGTATVVARGSVGLAVTRAGMRTPDALLHEADLAMYAAKRRQQTLAEVR